MLFLLCSVERVSGAIIRQFAFLNATLTGLGFAHARCVACVVCWLTAVVRRCFRRATCALRNVTAASDCDLAAFGTALNCDTLGNVVQISLVNQSLTGTIGSEIGRLVFLTTLNLHLNRLSSTIPNTLVRAEVNEF